MFEYVEPAARTNVTLAQDTPSVQFAATTSVKISSQIKSFLELTCSLKESWSKVQPWISVQRLSSLARPPGE
jgi:hypothetical protein